MAVTINFGTLVISVLQSDLTFISGSLYELDTNQFKKDVAAILDDEEGMPYKDAFSHNGEVTLAGVTFARTLEFINGYTITFEDLQYRVRLVGSNNNISDVANINQVSILSQNSAGLIVTDSGAGDWSVAEKEQLRDALGIGGTKTPASGGQLQNKAEPGDAMTLTAAERAALTDFLMKRDASNYESGAAKVSLAGAILKLMCKFSLDQTLDLATIFETDGTTPFATQAITKDSSLIPVKQLDKAT